MKKETMKCRKEIRLYSWELEELQKQAEKMGLSDSQYLRMLITNRPRDYPEIRQELERMNQEINAILTMPDVKEKLHGAFMEPIGGSTQDLANFMQTELRVMTPVIKRTGINVD